MREIEAAGPCNEGIEVKVSGVRKPRQYPADHLLGVFIPQEHPTLARVIDVATANAAATVETWLEITRDGQPTATITPAPDAAAPDAAGGGYLAHTGHDLTAVVTDLGGGDLRITGVGDEPPIGTIVSGWEEAVQHLWGPTAHARRVPGAHPAGTPASEAAPPGTATVADDGTSPGAADGRSSDAADQAHPETETGPAPQRPTGSPATEPGQVPVTMTTEAPAGTPDGTAGQDSEAARLAAAAGAIARERAAAHVRIDYARMKTVNKTLRAELTRAVNSGDPEKVIQAARNAVREWNKPGAAWPDNWSAWQRALDDVPAME